MNIFIRHRRNKAEINGFRNAFIAERKRKRKSKIKVGMESLGIPEIDFGAFKSALESTHYVKVRNIFGAAGLGIEKSYVDEIYHIIQSKDLPSSSSLHSRNI